jgi:hypothetical protein
MTIAPPDYQMTLLSVAPSYHITKNAQARNAYGTVANEIVCAALGLLPVRINGQYEACFDAYSDGLHYEVKSVKHGGKVIIYDWRREKEAKLGSQLYYAILCHGVKGSSGKELASEMAASELKLLVLPASSVHEVAAGEPLRMLQKLQTVTTGYNRKGYRDGYRNVPVGSLHELAPCETAIECRYSGLRFQVTLCKQQLP